MEPSHKTKEIGQTRGAKLANNEHGSIGQTDVALASGNKTGMDGPYTNRSQGYQTLGNDSIDTAMGKYEKHLIIHGVLSMLPEGARHPHKILGGLLVAATPQKCISDSIHIRPTSKYHYTGDNCGRTMAAPFGHYHVTGSLA